MSGGSGGEQVRLRLVADVVSVPAARRFVRDALEAWQRADLAADAELCASELSSNAALHSASDFFEVVVAHGTTGVRVSVLDQGLVPVEALVPRGRELVDAPAAEPGQDGRYTADLDQVPSTGRGLMIVSALATDWGVEATSEGKQVWAHLDGGDDGRTGRPSPQPPPAAAPVDAPAPALPAGWHQVRLAQCPVALGLRQDQHLDELVRELQLVETGPGTPSRELAEVISGLLRGQAHARHMGRRVSLDAAAAGLEVVDIDMVVPAVAAVEIRALDQAVRQADELCRAQQLLTLASPPEVVSLRDWMTHEFVAQIERGSPPTPYARWRAQA